MRMAKEYQSRAAALRGGDLPNLGEDDAAPGQPPATATASDSIRPSTRPDLLFADVCSQRHPNGVVTSLGVANRASPLNRQAGDPCRDEGVQPIVPAPPAI
jgi:hypothetical protein